MKHLILLFVTLFMATSAMAQDLAGLGRVLDGQVKDTKDGGVTVSFTITQRVPYAIDLLKDPDRIDVRFSTLSFQAIDLGALNRSTAISDIQITGLKADQVALSFTLARPLEVELVAMTDHRKGGKFVLNLKSVDQATFDAQAFIPLEQDTIVTSTTPRTRNIGNRPWVVALDPGHGGIDPGADGGRRSEADLMLLFAFELRDVLRGQGFDVVLTREEDAFVGLNGRMTLAREAKADVFLSLHADAVMEGVAEGVTVYTLSDRADSEADAKLAARHDRHDILGGVDLQGQGDEVAEVLLDMVRRETRPRSLALATLIVAGMDEQDVETNSKPLRRGDFAVLRSADIPSVLIELGFLSSPKDLARLNDVKGRAALIAGLAAGLKAWTLNDAAEAALIRQ